jgi:hypothetical protein
LQHDVQWDPGGSTRHRLVVKPKFKEGGMLATLVPRHGLDHGLHLMGLGCLRNYQSQRLLICWIVDTNNPAWIRTASASTA